MTDPTAPADANPTPAPEQASTPETPPTDTPPGGAAPAAEAPTPATRPDFIPEKFWDAKAGAPRVQELAKSYGELEQYRADRTAKVPEQYAPPAFLKGYEDQVGKGLEQLQEIAKGEGFSQQGFEQLARFAFGDPAAGMAKLKEAFGDKTDETLQAVRMHVGTYAEEYQPVLRQLTATPEGVKFLNELRVKGADPALPGQPGESGGGGLSQAKLNEMMADPRYWRDHDRAFIAQVEEGFRRLYPGMTRAAAQNPGEQVGSAA